MSTATPALDQGLHLPSLVIKNFRGIDELTIPRLGRVTLLAGKNGVGKTTVLDAVRVWADRGLNNVADKVLRERGDSFTAIDDREQKAIVDRKSLFTDHLDTLDTAISIGPACGTATLQIRQTKLTDAIVWPVEVPATLSDALDDVPLESQFGDHPSIIEGHKISPGHIPETVICDILGPNLPPEESVELHWNGVALSPEEDRAVAALNLIASATVERIASIDPPADSKQTHHRRLMAMVKGRDYPVTLRSLGDGAVRTFAVALALAKTSNGFLLIDEVENGIHHSVQPKFWKMVLQTAQRNNVQVLATTHSWDCVRGFARAANELEDVEGILYRIQRNLHRLRAVPYPEDQLAIAAESGIEVR